LDQQNDVAMRTVSSQPALITGPDALLVTSTSYGYLLFNFPDNVTPIITGAAVLVDKILDAGPGGSNQLMDPRGNMITEDALGQPRISTLRLRSVGAIQNPLVGIYPTE
jgi:hypothetical protein